MPDLERAKLLIEAWKKSVEVQQHFNDLSWRIRQLWLAALTFTLAASFLAFRDGSPINIPGIGVKTPALVIPFFGLILTLAFWFVDRHWYHRLLVGAVAEGKKLEKILADFDVPVELTKMIGDASPIKFRWLLEPLHARGKLTIFYLIGAIPLLLTMVLLWGI